MIKKFMKVLDEKMYIFLQFTESEIATNLPKNWTENGIFYINCRNQKDIIDAENCWKNYKMTNKMKN